MKKSLFVYLMLVFGTSVFANAVANDNCSLNIKPEISPTWSFVKGENLANSSRQDAKRSAREFFDNVDRFDAQNRKNIENDKIRRIDSNKNYYEQRKYSN